MNRCLHPVPAFSDPLSLLLVALHIPREGVKFGEKFPCRRACAVRPPPCPFPGSPFALFFCLSSKLGFGRMPFYEQRPESLSNELKNGTGKHSRTQEQGQHAQHRV